jgi:hypothetical protein
MSERDLDDKLTEIAAYAFGNTWAITGMLCAMIEAGAISRSAAVTFLSNFAKAMREDGMGPCATLPLEHLTMFIGMTGGDSAGDKQMDLSALRDFVQSRVREAKAQSRI